MAEPTWEYAEVRRDERLNGWTLAANTAVEDQQPHPWPIAVLDAAGADGWELVCSYQRTGEDTAFVLKRAKQARGGVVY